MIISHICSIVLRKDLRHLCAIASKLRDNPTLTPIRNHDLKSFASRQIRAHKIEAPGASADSYRMLCATR